MDKEKLEIKEKKKWMFLNTKFTMIFYLIISESLSK